MPPSNQGLVRCSLPFALGAVGAKRGSPATRVSVTDCTSFCASVSSVLFFVYGNESMTGFLFFLFFKLSPFFLKLEEMLHILCQKR